MISPKDHDVMKIVEQLEKENVFTSDEVSLIEDYLCGDVGDEVLEKFAYRDLSGISGAYKIQNVYVSMLGHGKEDMARRFEKLFFALGEATSYELFSMLGYSWRKEEIMLEPEKKAALHAMFIGSQQNFFTKGKFERLMNHAKRKPENLKKAMEYRTGKDSKGILVLLTAYFYLKYSRAQEGVKLEEEDEALMELYENMLVNGISDIFSSSFQKSYVNEIKTAVMEDRVDEQILKLAGGSVNGDHFVLRILSGTAFVNYFLSLKLKNVVTICLAVDCECVLDYMDTMDLRCDFSRLAGRIDTEFHLDSRELIEWAAQQHKLKILKEHLEKAPDSIFCRRMI